MEFLVKEIDKDLKIEFPRIYYLGYELTFENGDKYDIVLGKDGLINSNIDKKGKYKLEYKGTKLDNIAILINWASLFIYIIYLVRLKKVGRRYGDK